MREKSITDNPPPRQTRTTRQQHEVYLAFLEGNPSFAGHSKKLTEAMNHQWAQLAEELNTLTPQRSVENWKTVNFIVTFVYGFV